MILHKPKPHTPLFVSFIDRIYQTNKQDSQFYVSGRTREPNRSATKRVIKILNFRKSFDNVNVCLAIALKFFFFVFFLSHKVGSNFKLSREFGFLKEEWIVVRGFGFL